jgi:polyphosphate kinase
VVPVADPELKRQVELYLELELADDTLAWELARDGTWRKAALGRGVNTQELMQRTTLGVVNEAGGSAA